MFLQNKHGTHVFVLFVHPLHLAHMCVSLGCSAVKIKQTRLYMCVVSVAKIKGNAYNASACVFALRFVL